MSTKTIIATVPLKQVTTVTKAIQHQPRGQGKSRSARRRRKGNTLQQPQKNSSFASAYARCLLDPFSNPPQKLGLGTMVPTEIGFAHVNQRLAAAADGSLLVMVRPSVRYPLAYSLATAAVAPVWVRVSDTAYASAAGAFEAARPIAMGIRITPDTAATDRPSRVAVAQLSARYTSPATAAGVDALALNTWASSHLANNCIMAAGGSTSCVGTWRPMDLDNFVFERDVLLDPVADAATAITPMFGPALFCAITGPASAAYFIETVFFYEATCSPYTFMGISDAPNTGYSSLDSFFEALRPYMTAQNAVKLVQAAAGVASTAHISLKGFNSHKTMFQSTTSPGSLEEKKEVTTSQKIEIIEKYITQLDLASLSDSDRQHLVNISSALYDSPVLVNRGLARDGSTRTSRPSHQ